jgi:EAL domain-containing protein (putative c-di-GMP-specific phosphodiesterase class I)
METSMILLKELRSLGVRVSLDDFGSDYSTLSYLMQLPVDFVKIDGSFARCLGESPRARVIVEAIISLAHALGLEAVGEGVESAEQLEHLRSMGCDLVQGLPPRKTDAKRGSAPAPRNPEDTRTSERPAGERRSASRRRYR